MMCEACERGDHANCGMQSWCNCDDDTDGDSSNWIDFVDPNEAIDPMQPFRITDDEE
jgi:hypothetical protein